MIVFMKFRVWELTALYRNGATKRFCMHCQNTALLILAWNALFAFNFCHRLAQIHSKELLLRNYSVLSINNISHSFIHTNALTIESKKDLTFFIHRTIFIPSPWQRKYKLTVVSHDNWKRYVDLTLSSPFDRLHLLAYR